LYLPLVVKDSVSGITAAVVKGAQLNDIWPHSSFNTVANCNELHLNGIGCVPFYTCSWVYAYILIFNKNAILEKYWRTLFILTHFASAAPPLILLLSGYQPVASILTRFKSQTKKCYVDTENYSMATTYLNTGLMQWIRRMIKWETWGRWEMCQNFDQKTCREKPT
jgi:hypothetical protein